MDKLKILLDEYASAKTEEIKKQKVNESVDIIKQSNLVSMLITVCEKYLVDSVDTNRKIGIQFLSDIIINENIEFQIPLVYTIYEFFLVRIEDFPTSEECTEALYRILVRYGNQMVDCSIKTVEIYSQVGNVSSMKYPSRHNVYKTLLYILNSPQYYTLIREKGLQYVKWLCNIMSNEKDPRGLLEILTILNKVCILYDDLLDLCISGEIFDILSNYFPITFTRPPNDIFKITSEDLKTSLNSCFLSSIHLQEFLLPFLLERVDSNIYNNQKDGLILLYEHIQKYRCEFVNTDIKEWIDILINACINALDDTIQKLSFDIISLIIKITEEDDKTQLFDGYLNPFLELPEKYVYDAPSSLTAHNTMKLIRVILQSSYLCLPQCIQIIKTLINSYNHEENRGLKNAYLWCINEYISAFISDVYTDTTIIPITNYIKNLIDIYNSCQLEDSIAYYHINGLFSLLHVTSLLSLPVASELLSSLTRLLLVLDPDQYIYIQTELYKYMNQQKEFLNKSSLCIILLTLIDSHVNYQYLLTPSLYICLQDTHIYTNEFIDYIKLQISTIIEQSQPNIQLITYLTQSILSTQNKEALSLCHVKLVDHVISTVFDLISSSMNKNTIIEIMHSVYYYLFAILYNLSSSYDITNILKSIQVPSNNVPLSSLFQFHVYICLFPKHILLIHDLLFNMFKTINETINIETYSTLFSTSILYLYIYYPENSIHSLVSLCDYQNIRGYQDNKIHTFTVCVPILQSLYLRSDPNLVQLLKDINIYITTVTDINTQHFYLEVLGKIFSPISSLVSDIKPNTDFITIISESSFPVLFKFIEEKHISLDTMTTESFNNTDMLLLKTIFLFSLFLPRDALTPYVSTLLPLLLVDLSCSHPVEETFKLIYILSLSNIDMFATYLNILIPLLIKTANQSSIPFYRLVSVYILNKLVSLQQNKINIYIDDVIYGLKPVLNDNQRSVRIITQKTVNLWSIARH